MTYGLKRYYGRNDLHFITFSCHQRLPLLNHATSRNIFLQELAKLRIETNFRLVGYVVMPEHVHLLVSEPAATTPSFAIQKLKQRSSRLIHNSAAEKPSAPQPYTPNKHATPFWQPRFYDFNVYSLAKKNEKLNYMHANPVIRGLVHHPQEWTWSSWSFYMKGESGLVPIDAAD